MSLQRFASSLLCQSCASVFIKRNIVVLKHVFPPPTLKPGRKKLMKAKHFTYDVVSVDTVNKIPPIDCILTTHVDGLGERGDTVSVKRRIFRHELYPAGLAVYASPDSITMFEKEAESTKHIPKLSRYAYLTWLQLWGIHLDIPMSGEESWVLDKSHIRVAFRLAGIELEEECINLPEDDITSPQDLTLTVNVNGIKEATVSATIYPVYKESVKNVAREPRPWLSREECYEIIQKQTERQQAENRTSDSS